jgi:pimeloyl-ACP methyl ester carboxylesterase
MQILCALRFLLACGLLLCCVLAPKASAESGINADLCIADARNDGLSRNRTGLTWIYIHGVENKDEASFLQQAKVIHRELIRTQNHYRFFGKPVACQFGYVYWGDLANGVQSVKKPHLTPSSRQILNLGLTSISQKSTPVSATLRQSVHQFSHDAIWYLTNPTHQSAISARIQAVLDKVRTQKEASTYVLAGHSMGSVIALNTILTALQYDHQERQSLAGLVTFGSPINALMSSILEARLRQPGSFFDLQSVFTDSTSVQKPWLNIYFVDDPIASTLAAAYAQIPDKFTFRLVDVSLLVKNPLDGLLKGQMSPHSAYFTYPDAFIESLKAGERLISAETPKSK